MMNHRKEEMNRVAGYVALANTGKRLSTLDWIAAGIESERDRCIALIELLREDMGNTAYDIGSQQAIDAYEIQRDALDRLMRLIEDGTEPY